jgi:hypothetical protein
MIDVCPFAPLSLTLSPDDGGEGTGGGRLLDNEPLAILPLA